MAFKMAFKMAFFAAAAVYVQQTRAKTRGVRTLQMRANSKKSKRLFGQF